jgi:hypothetical protein
MMLLTQLKFLWRAVTGVAPPKEVSNLIGLKGILRGSSFKGLFPKEFLDAENRKFWIFDGG